MGKIVGIDLGTTNSVVATVDMGGNRILQNKEAESQTRSVVGFYKGDFLIGAPALRRWPLAAKETIISIKRLMGRAYSDPEVEKIKKWAQYEIIEPSAGTKDSVCVKLGGKEYFPVDISAMILKKLKEDAEFVLGDEVTHAVITVPAYFSDPQRAATREAGLKAGLKVMKILDEPTAAAIAFGMDAKEKEAKTVLVYDLGGGTFDVSLLMMAAGAFAQLNLEGNMWLGGDNFDQVIVDHVISQINKEYNINPEENDRFMATLKMEAQKAKEALSSSRIAQIVIPGILQNDSGEFVDIDTELTREQYEEMIQPLIDKTVSLVKKAVENANYELNDIDYVLMAGNSTCIPKVQEAMEQLFGKEKILRKVHPKNSVAIGAAMTAVIYGGVKCSKCDHDNPIEAEKCENCGTALELMEKKICPSCGKSNKKDAEKCEVCGGPFVEINGIKGGIAPFHYGVQTAGDTFNVFINKSDRYETLEDKRQVQTFFTRFPGQRIISIPVYGGDNLESAAKNVKMGEAFAILPENLPKDTPVQIKLWLNPDGYFDLTAQLEDGRDLNPRILRGGGDQQVIGILMECDNKERKKESILSPKEKERAKEYRDEVLDNLENNKIEDAKNKADEFNGFIEKAGKKRDPLLDQAEGLIGYITHIVNRYDWVIGQIAYDLNNLKGELQEAIRKNDRSIMESKTKEISAELEKLMQTTLLGAFMAMLGAIGAMIHPVDPALAQNLREELEGVERVFKTGQPDAMARLNAFSEKVQKIIKGIKLPEEGIPCPRCKKLSQNPRDGRYCEFCGDDLWTLVGKRTSTITKS